MVNSNVSNELLGRLNRLTEKMSQAPDSLQTGGGGGTFDGMEARVTKLEDDMGEIRKDLKALLIDSAEMKGMLKGMPSAQSFGELKGRVDSLPTTAKVATLLGIAVAIITIATRWAEFSALLK